MLDGLLYFEDVCQLTIVSSGCTKWLKYNATNLAYQFMLHCHTVVPGCPKQLTHYMYSLLLLFP